MKGITRRAFLARSALAGVYGAAAGAAARVRAAEAPLPWRNWSGGQVAHPVGRVTPVTEDELVRFLQTTSGPLRPVGAGHSFSGLVPTNGRLLILDRLAGLIGHDPGTRRATLGAGTRLANTGPLLEAVGQAMINLPDIDRQTLAGATATATHGTGIEFTSLSGYVTGMRLITPRGEVLDINADANRDLLGAARVALGALGVVTRVELQNRTGYRLKEQNSAEPTEDVLARFDKAAASHRHFEMFPLTHSDYALVLAIDETDEPIDNPPPDPEEEAAFGAAMASWTQVPPGERRPLVNGLAEQIEPTSAVDVSYKILANIRNDRFNEMEYSVPLAAGADCLREILRTIRDKQIDVVFPLEYRYISGDDTWLSMFSGGPRAAISIHRAAAFDYRPYFDLIEPIFWKYEGRPHWGKLHSLGYAELDSLYPRLEEFKALRAELDPDGRFLNDHLRHLLGIAS